MASIRFPSFETIIDGAKRGIARFPVAMGFFLVAAFATHVRIVRSFSSEESWIRFVVIASGMGFLAIAARLRLESRQIHRRVEWVSAAALLALGTLLYFVAPKFGSIAGAIFLSQWVLLILAVLTLAPFSRRREFRGFWRHNHAIIDKALLAAIFSGAAFAGLSLAFFALEGLFVLHVHRDVYAHLATALFGSVAPWFALSAYPADVRSLDSDVPFPGALRSFAQWVMVPLVSVYAIILLVYAAQIGFKGEWPKGMVGWLVSWAGALGLMTNLVLLPMAEKHELKWLRLFLRGFYAALIVFAGLLALATYRRVSEYGWTEERVLLALLSGWFFGLALFFTLRPSATRQWIPATIGILALITCSGPLSPTFISQRDQTQRLEKLLERIGVRKNGTAVALTTDLDVKTRRQLWDQIDFFSDRDLLRKVQPLFPPLKEATSDLSIGDLLLAMGQSKDFPIADEEPSMWSIAPSDEAVATEGFDRFVQVRLPGWHFKLGRSRSDESAEAGVGEFVSDGVRWKLVLTEGTKLTIEDMSNRVKVTFDLVAWATRMRGKFSSGGAHRVPRLSSQEIAIDGQSDAGWKARLFLQSARVQADEGTYRVSVDHAWLAFRVPGK